MYEFERCRFTLHSVRYRRFTCAITSPLQKQNSVATQRPCVFCGAKFAKLYTRNSYVKCFWLNSKTFKKTLSNLIAISAFDAVNGDPIKRQRSTQTMSQPNLVNPSKREVLNKREYPDMKCRIRRSCQIGARSPTTTRSRASR